MFTANWNQLNRKFFLMGIDNDWDNRTKRNSKLTSLFHLESFSDMNTADQYRALFQVLLLYGLMNINFQNSRNTSLVELSLLL